MLSDRLNSTRFQRQAEDRLTSLEYGMLGTCMSEKPDRPASAEWCGFKGTLIPAGHATHEDPQLARKGWRRARCPVCGRMLRARPGIPVRRHRVASAERAE